MKKLFVVLFVFGGLVSLFAGAKHFWRGETLGLKQAERRWGFQEFDEKRFREASITEKSKMTASLLKLQEKYKGMDVTEIRNRFGDYDGFYFSDMYPTYIIEEGKNAKDDTWQLVFLLDRAHKISEIIVHKNCCDR